MIAEATEAMAAVSVEPLPDAAGPSQSHEAAAPVAAPGALDGPEEGGTAVTAVEPAEGSPAPAAPQVAIDGATTEDAEDDSDFEAAASAEGVEAKLIKALSFKERGNESIGAGEFAAARKHYERGIKLAGSLPGNEQAAGLSLTLHLNLCLACAKLGDHFESARVAGVVLQADPANVKGLFRRGVARAELGLLEDARSDLTAVVKADPKNVAARKTLAGVKSRLEAAREAEKAAYGGLFKRSGSLYDDRQQQQDAEKAAWRQANEDRVAMGLGHQTFEEWGAAKRGDKDLPPAGGPSAAEAAGAAGGATPLSPSQQAELAAGAAAAAAAPKKAAAPVEDDDGLDEEDLKIISETKKQGYCYFRRTLPEAEAELLEKEQQKLRAAVAPRNSPTMAANGSASAEGAAGADGVRQPLSAAEWNSGGTWEEIDKTTWAKARLRSLLTSVRLTDGGVDPAGDPGALMRELKDFDFGSAARGEEGLRQLEALGVRLAQVTARVTAVGSLEGSAHVTLARGRKRCLFDFSAELDVEISVDKSLGAAAEFGGAASEKGGARPELFRGKLRVPEMTSEDVDRGAFETEPQFSPTKDGTWPTAYEERVKAASERLKEAVLGQVKVFWAEYQAL